MPIKGTREGGLWLIDEEVYGPYIASGLGRDYDPNVILSGKAEGVEIPAFSMRPKRDTLSAMVWFERFRAMNWAVVLIGCLLVFQPAAPVGASDADKALIEDLRAGGLVIYFRHSATDWTQDDNVTKAGDWKSCDGAEMRQLSDTGRDIARTIGKAMRALKIPAGEILSSEYCRSAETARLFGLGDVRTTTEIMNLRSQEYVGGHDAAVKNVRMHFTRPVPPGTNRIMVGHGNLMRAATGNYTDEAGAVMVRPEPGSELGFVLVAIVTPQNWLRLAAEFGGGK